MSGDRLRLAYLCSDPGIPIDGSKGASVHFRAMAQALATIGVTVDGFVARGAADAVAGVEFQIVPPPPGSDTAREAGLVAGALDMLQAMDARAPHDAVYERLSLFGMAGLAHARRHRLPFLVEVNAPLWEEAARFRTLHLPRAAHALALDVLEGADRVLVVSAEIGRQLVAEGIDGRKLVVQPNGVDAELFASAAPAARPAKFGARPVLAFVGSLKPWHGIEFLLAAHAACREDLGFCLWIVGDGPLREQVEAAARRYPDEIVSEGAVPHARVPAVLQAADAVVAPYPADAPAYFCPLKVVEALALGCPLVASRVPCVLDLVRGRPGVELFAAGEVAEFAAAVRRALAHPRVPDPAHLQAQAWTARARVVVDLVDACRAKSAGVGR